MVIYELLITQVESNYNSKTKTNRNIDIVVHNDILFQVKSSIPIIPIIFILSKQFTLTRIRVRIYFIIMIFGITHYIMRIMKILLIWK